MQLLNIYPFDYNFHLVKLLVMKSFLTEVFWLALGSFLISNIFFSFTQLDLIIFSTLTFFSETFSCLELFPSPRDVQDYHLKNKEVGLEHSYSFILNRFLHTSMNYEIKPCLPSESNSLGSVLISTSEQSSSVHTLPLFLFEFFWG